MKISLFYLFLYSFCLTMFLPLFLPFWHIPYFTPFLVFCFYRCTLVSCLWWSLICGFIIDLFSAETRLGTYAMNYCLTTFYIYHYKLRFFEDRFSTLPTLAFGFTCLSTLIQIAIFYVISKPFALSLAWGVNDLLVIPLQVACYTILTFNLPFSIFIYLKRHYLLFRLNRKRL